MTRPSRLVACVAGVALLSIAAPLVSAQRGGRGGAPSGGAGGGGVQKGRLDQLTDAFTLDKDQKKQVKTLLDDGYKIAAPVRDQLTKTHNAMGVAVQGGKPQAEIDAATHAYAVQAAAMAEAETKALAGIMKLLTNEQRANTAGAQTAFFLARGMFADSKWDKAPDGRNY